MCSSTTTASGTTSIPTQRDARARAVVQVLETDLTGQVPPAAAAMWEWLNQVPAVEVTDEARPRKRRSAPRRNPPAPEHEVPIRAWVAAAFGLELHPLTPLPRRLVDTFHAHEALPDADARALYAAIVEADLYENGTSYIPPRRWGYRGQVQPDIDEIRIWAEREGLELAHNVIPDAVRELYRTLVDRDAPGPIGAHPSA